MRTTTEQQAIIEAVQEGKDVLVQALAGTGKAQPLDELVLTPAGYVQMKDIVIGSNVISKQGKAIKVLDTITTENLRMFNICFSDGTSVRACKDHLWEVNRRTKVNGKSTKVKDVLTTEDMLLIVKRYKNKPANFAYPYSVDLCRPVEFPAKELLIEPYHMGYFLGNGHSSKSGGVYRLSIHEEDKEEIKDYLDTSLLKRESQYNTKSCDLHFYNTSNHLLANYHLRSIKSIDKFIPFDYLHSTTVDRIRLLQGLMDSDGTCTNNKARFSSSSLRLIEDVQYLVRSLGGKATISISERIKEDSRRFVEYNLQIRTPFNPFLLKRKATNYTVLHRDLHNFKAISSIDFIGTATGKCLVVDSIDHLYLTKDFTVTHNSSTLRLLAEATPNKNFLVLCFNAANAEESNNHPSKPSNIIYSTVHALAYATTMQEAGFRKKLNAYLDFTNLDEELIVGVIGKLPVDTKKYREIVIKVKRAILEVVTYYCRTDKHSIIAYAESLLSSWFTPSDSEYYRHLELSLSQIQQLSTYCKEYWLQLIDSKRTDVKITHDVYLKLFELRNSTIREVTCKTTKDTISIDVIALDEAQDSSPVTLSIFNKQKHLQQVGVGDENQQLYSWRGAGECMSKFPTFTKLPLTVSWRFNQRIADMANEVLLLNSSNLQLIGGGTKDIVDTRAHLARTNASVLIASMNYIAEGKKVFANVDLNDIFSKLWHLQSCYFNEKPKYPNKELANIIDKQTMLEALQYDDQLVLVSKLGKYLNETYGNLTKAKAALQGKLYKEAKEADIVVSTIHRSKGLGFSSVVIDEDLVPFDKEKECYDVKSWLDSFDNRCLLYVAITRAEVEVTLPYYINL